MNHPHLLPIAAWWHRIRLHLVRHDVVLPDEWWHRWHTYCLTCQQGWEYDQ